MQLKCEDRFDREERRKMKGCHLCTSILFIQKNIVLLLELQSSCRATLENNAHHVLEKRRQFLHLYNKLTFFIRTRASYIFGEKILSHEKRQQSRNKITYFGCISSLLEDYRD
jgi:hypothetical protein